LRRTEHLSPRSLAGDSRPSRRDALDQSHQGGGLDEARLDLLDDGILARHPGKVRHERRDTLVLPGRGGDPQAVGEPIGDDVDLGALARRRA
jgi:hypothetical protein